MAEKVREASARGDATRLARLLDDGAKPLPDEVSSANNKNKIIYILYGTFH